MTLKTIEHPWVVWWRDQTILEDRIHYFRTDDRGIAEQQADFIDRTGKVSGIEFDPGEIRFNRRLGIAIPLP